MILDKLELIELTGRRVKSAQVRALRYMGIEHRMRPDGSIAVLKAHVEQLLGATNPTVNRRTEEIEPNWSAM